MQVQTIWQPHYSPTGFARVQVRVKKTIDARLFEYLDKHGAKPKDDILKDTGLTPAQLRHAVALLRDQIEFEQSGGGTTRVCLYWLKDNPPPIEKRCGSHRVHVWYQENPWRAAKEIPDEIYSVGGHKHGCACMLEKAGRLISRVKNGLKQYKAVI